MKNPKTASTSQSQEQPEKTHFAAETLLSSSPCLQHESSLEYAGQCGTQEILEALSALIAEKQAGASLCASLLSESAHNTRYKHLQRIERDCHDRLLRCAQHLQAQSPSPLTPTHYKLQPLSRCASGLQLLQQSQALTISELSNILPRIRQQALFDAFVRIRAQQQSGIEITKLCLSRSTTR